MMTVEIIREALAHALSFSAKLPQPRGSAPAPATAGRCSQSAPVGAEAHHPAGLRTYDSKDPTLRSTCARVRKCWKISSSAKPPQPRGGAPAPATAGRCSNRSPTNLPLQSSRNREALLLLPQPRGGAGRCYLARAIFLDLRSRGPFLHIPLGIRSRDRGALLDLPFLCPS